MVKKCIINFMVWFLFTIISINCCTIDHGHVKCHRRDIERNKLMGMMKKNSGRKEGRTVWQFLKNLYPSKCVYIIFAIYFVLQDKKVRSLFKQTTFIKTTLEWNIEQKIWKHCDKNLKQIYTDKKLKYNLTLTQIVFC